MKILAFAILLFALTYALAQTKSSGWEGDMKRFAALDSAHRPEPGMILFTGSSSITKWQDIQQYFPKHKVLNRGFGGTQFPDLIRYAEKVIYQYKPSKIFIYEGDNDLNAGRSPEQVLTDAKTLREMIEKNLPGTPVVFISPKPSIARWALKDKYIKVNADLKTYAAKTKDTKFADVWTPMIGADGRPVPVFISDNLHMTADGYKIWQKVLEPFLLN